uniref:Uncharacterized protein n=1 Tax=Romanomermis culicivorax TaxID=13658 RepID=A0A915HR59_ROMCU
MKENESMVNNQIGISGDPVAKTGDSTTKGGKSKKIVGGGTLQQPIEFAEESAGSRSLKSDKSPILEKDKKIDNGQGGQDEPRVHISSNVKAVSYEDESEIKYPPGGQFYASTSPSSTPNGSLPMDELAMKSRGLVDSAGHHKRAHFNKEDIIW